MAAVLVVALAASPKRRTWKLHVMELGIGEVNGAMALGTALGLETGFTRS